MSRPGTASPASGAVAHTINPRLFREQIAYIANHAEDRVLAFDLTFLAFVEELAPELKTVEHFILLTDRAHMPRVVAAQAAVLRGVAGRRRSGTPLARLDENAPAGLCYTSGTTGNPKGVLYSHRSNVLHAFAACMTDTFAIGVRTCVLPIAPMFHANSWGIPYAAAMAGAKLVLNGPELRWRDADQADRRRRRQTSRWRCRRCGCRSSSIWSRPAAGWASSTGLPSADRRCRAP